MSCGKKVTRSILKITKMLWWILMFVLPPIVFP